MFKKLLRTKCFLVATGLLALGLLAGFIAGRQTAPGSGVLPWPGSTKTIRGPWGEIHYWNSILETPYALLTKWSGSYDKPTKWFVGLTKEEADRFLDECGMSPAMRDTLLSTEKEEPNGGIRLYPSDAFVISIPPDLRSKLYYGLAKWPENKTVRSPTQFVKGGQLDWLKKSGLPSDVIKLTKKLIYKKNGVELFANYDIVLRTISDNRIARRFLRVMCRQSSVMGVLVVRPEDDLEALANYWGRGGREDEIRTLLEAARVSEGSREIPLLSLLPPFAKDRLYRYQNDTDPETANCHYTSFNFFSSHPDTRFTELSACAEALGDYVTVTNEYQLGDIVALMYSADEASHTCTALAGNLMFTKNGTGKGQPWTIQTLENLLVLYGIDQPLTVKVLRRSDMF